MDEENFEKPILVRSLSEHHWLHALEELRKNNLDSIVAGTHCDEWIFVITKIHELIYKDVFKNNFLIKRELF